MTDSSYNNDKEDELYIIMKYNLRVNDPDDNLSPTLISWHKIPTDFFAFLGLAFHNGKKYEAYRHFRNRTIRQPNIVYRELLRNLVVYDRLFLQDRT